MTGVDVIQHSTRGIVFGDESGGETRALDAVVAGIAIESENEVNEGR